MIGNKILLIILSVWIGLMNLNAQYQERIFLQTDKQLYISGELIWLKLYSTDSEGKLLSLSKIGYVELVRDSIAEVQIKVDIPDGTGAGCIELPPTLPTGFYRLIAYTRYMRNEGENVFFEKQIAIVNPFSPYNDRYTEDTYTPFAIKPIEKESTTIELMPNRSTYTKRSNGEIRIKGLPTENISMGISIAGIEPELTASSTTIADWKKQMPKSGVSFSYDKMRFLPEYEGAIIDGVLIDTETGNPVSASHKVITLLSFPGQEVQLFSGQIDESGNTSFYTLCATGKKELVTTTLSPTGKNYRVDIHSPFATHASRRLPFFRPDSTWLNYLQQRNLSVQVTKAFLTDSIIKIRGTAPCSYLRPYSTYILDDYTRFPNMEEVFIEFIMFASIRNTPEGRRFSLINEMLNGSSTNVLVLLDNIPVIDHELMSDYNPLLIKTIELYLGDFIIGVNAFDGIIAFHSYENNFPDITFGANTQLFSYEGTQPYKYFYMPEHENITLRIPDFRHTLLWEPSIQSNGRQELTIPFTTSDLPGTYIITVEGIGANGTTIRLNHTIEVTDE
ncbi:MAG: hypothetical protein LBE56_01360 [Tannerella sp.]|jgi:hypothetical protein|nr:hypothetical protein [Tannerella sp.]